MTILMPSKSSTQVSGSVGVWLSMTQLWQADRGGAHL